MPEDTAEIRKIDWFEAFPAARLLRTAGRALAFWPMLLALLCVVLVYVSGRVLDSVWVASGHGLAKVGQRTEIYGYALGHDDFAAWLTEHAKLGQHAAQVGPFAALMDYEMMCLAGAVRGVATWNLSLAGSPFGPGNPSMLGSLAAADRGLTWLVTQHPVYAIVFGLVAVALWSLFGLAICRAAAVRAIRHENLSAGAAMAFAREKFLEGLFAPLMPVVILVVVAIVMVIGSLVGAIPVIGEILAGLTYGLALLGGVALAFAVLAFVFGSHLMWPTIAVEGSDSFDAVQRAGGYLFQRPWTFAFYSFVLFVFGGLSALLLRCVLMLVLKLTHTVTGLGISFFGMLHSSGDASLGKLDGMWTMPTWANLSLLPGYGSLPIWGTFGNTAAPLSGSETVGSWLIAIWVFLVVGLLAAYIVSFYFCGCTEMYLLLRRQVDAVDYDEMFYEEFDETDLEEEPTEGDKDSATDNGTSLPVVDDSK